MLKLIDLDGAVSFNEGEYNGLKFSTACLPPEMIYRSGNGEYKVRSTQDWTPESGYDLLPASPSQDMWSLGCVFYLLCTGATLFQATIEDNLVFVSKDMAVLYHWTEQTKREKLSIVTDNLARNLLSLLLNKNPAMRLDGEHVLSHPFLTGAHFCRLQGEEPEWDVFLSYRVDSDSGHAEELYNALCQKGLKVWWDKRCLEPGQNWEEGFVSGLVTSRCFVCLLSRGAIKSDSKDGQNFEWMTQGSKGDHVLSEWRLALELKERTMIEGVFPVMIGDVGANGEYSHYFKSNCNPSAPNIVVHEVERKLRDYLSGEGLGLPYTDRLTIKAVLDSVLSNQGAFYCERKEDFLPSTVDSICDMVRRCKNHETPIQRRTLLASSSSRNLDADIVVGGHGTA